MKLLIDGYNLLYAANITGRPGRGTSLFRSRLELLQQLAERLEPAERASTTIVFDAQNAPPGLPKRGRFREIEVLFAERKREADDLVIELIESSSHAREMTVVSSDHRIQRAAAKKKARAVDSRQWWNERSRRRPRPESETKLHAPLSSRDIAEWLHDYTGTIEELEQAINGDAATEAPSHPADETERPIENPFPPGYADDLLDDF